MCTKKVNKHLPIYLSIYVYLLSILERLSLHFVSLPELQPDNHEIVLLLLPLRGPSQAPGPPSTCAGALQKDLRAPFPPVPAAPGMQQHYHARVGSPHWALAVLRLFFNVIFACKQVNSCILFNCIVIQNNLLPGQSYCN